MVHATAHATAHVTAQPTAHAMVQVHFDNRNNELFVRT
jgi:hypothetical protein